MILIIGTPPTTYINASPIKFQDMRQQFIAAQAPKPNSFENFWQMILDREVRVIIMLTDLREGGRPKADQYWPDKEMELENGIKIQLFFRSYQGIYLLRLHKILKRYYLLA